MIWSDLNNNNEYYCVMECSIGGAGGAIAPPDFNLVGQIIHYAPPYF